MKYRSKKGVTLVELVAVFPLIALIITAGIGVFLVAHYGFSRGTSDFNGNMQATLLKTVLDKSLPTAGGLSFTTPEDGCAAIFYEDGSLVFAENYLTETEKRYTVENVQSLTIRIESSGANCKLSYRMTLDENGEVRSFNGSMMLLNITGGAFSSANGGVSLPAQYVISEGTASSMYMTPLENPGGSGGGGDDIYPDLSYTFTTSPYSGGFNYTLTITNNSDVIVYGWVIEFDYPGTLTSAYNGTLKSLGDNRYSITSVANTDVISPGATVSAGGSGTTYGGNTLSNVVIKKPYTSAELNVSMKLTITDKWNQNKPSAGFNYSVVITNHGTDAVTGWVLQFNYDGIITSVWGGETFQSLGSGRYEIKCPTTYDYTIPPNGGTVTFGGGGTKVGTKASVATLNGDSITVS